MNAFFLVDVGDMMIIDVQIFPMRKRGDRLANEIVEMIQNLFSSIQLFNPSHRSSTIRKPCFIAAVQTCPRLHPVT